jgi:hypothetical protein
VTSLKRWTARPWTVPLNSDVARGRPSRANTDADTPVLNKKTTGRFVGHALETVTSGATATIQVRLSN